eukprot:m.69537 g.69537  ORF g.69537 m.69537 type:complete len:111 (-) comp12062_c0_seq2:406-738(-)
MHGGNSGTCEFCVRGLCVEEFQGIYNRKGRSGGDDGSGEGDRKGGSGGGRMGTNKLPDDKIELKECVLKAIDNTYKNLDPFERYKRSGYPLRKPGENDDSNKKEYLGAAN